MIHDSMSGLVVVMMGGANVIMQLAWALGPAHRFVTAGFLPAPFRDALGLGWSPQRQRATTGSPT